MMYFLQIKFAWIMIKSVKIFVAKMDAIMMYFDANKICMDYDDKNTKFVRKSSKLKIEFVVDYDDIA